MDTFIISQAQDIITFIYLIMLTLDGKHDINHRGTASISLINNKFKKVIDLVRLKKYLTLCICCVITY